MKNSFRYFFIFIILLGVTLLCSLGCWQLSRAKQKEDLLQKISLTGLAPPLSATELLKNANQPDLRFHPVSLQGRFLNGNTILLDNKIYKGQVGYEVYVPLLINNDTLILINRGFMKQERSRQHLPHIPAVNDTVTIEGYLDFSYRNPFILRATETTQVQWPLLMQQLDLSLVGKILGKKIYPLIITLRPGSPYAFDLENKSVGFSPKRHLGYAFQWFSLAVALFLFPFFVYFFREKK